MVLRPLGKPRLFSIFVNTGGTANVHRCTFGPAGKWAFYNNTTNGCDVSYDYWASSDGPQVAPWILHPGDVNGSGAHLKWRYPPSDRNTPSSPSPRVNSSLNPNVSLSSGGTLTWNSPLGVTLGLSAQPNSTVLNGEITGVLRVNDTASLDWVVPPPGLVPGQIYVVSGQRALRFRPVPRVP